MRTLSLSLFLAVAGLLGSGCGPVAKQCSPASCLGCCDASGECQGGSSNLACGASGGQCIQCAFGSLCQLGVCLNTVTGGGSGGGSGGGATGGGGGSSGGGGGTTGGGTGGATGGGGGTGGGVTGGGTGGGVTGGGTGGGVTGGGTGGGVTGGGTGGGVTGGGTGGGVTGGGTGGGATGGGTGGGATGGGGGTCIGCVESGACVPVGNQSSAACGLGASACSACSVGQECVNGGCVAQANTCLEISPADLDFGPTQTGCNAYRVVTLTNRCTAPLSLNALALPPADFFLRTPVSLPLTLVTNQSQLVELRFAPTSAGPRVASLVVTWASGANLYQSTLGLFGSGSTVAAVTESYTVPTTADLLLVVDDSCSMTDKQGSFAANMATFLSYATTNNVSWNAAVVSHDNDFGLTKGGNFIGSPKVISLTTPSPAQTLATRVQLGANGSATEVGLTTAWKALTPPLVTAGNAGFLRPGATLSVVLLTDAEDQSSGTVANWVAHFRSLRGGRAHNAISVAGFIPTGSGTCGYDTPPTGRYAGVIAALGGFSEEICDHVSAAPWSRLGELAAGRRNRWFLNNTPTSAAALSVSLGLVTMPPSTWAYDAATNSVTFVSPNAPGPGQSVTFSYSATCAP
ncbi:MAG: choice-of-anchor D domain-containing protein [Archangium sp.]|nr:choice-of-anchor D domain-containing protein [Archangium sp.]